MIKVINLVCIVVPIILSFWFKNVFLFALFFGILLNSLKINKKMQITSSLVMSIVWVILILKLPLSYVLLWIPLIPNIHIVIWILKLKKGERHDQ